MGTRSITIIKDENNNTLVTLYRQYDGHIYSHGHDLGNFLKDKIIVNGFGDTKSKTEFNGAGCMAAQIIAHLKVGIGNFYLMPELCGDCGQEYVYTITLKNNKINIRVYDEYDKKALIFEGTPEEILKIKR